jgi:hypothetical protein
MKKPFLFLLSLLCFTVSFAQSLITGHVVDAETKLPLEGASVFAQNTTRGTITNKEGAFRLQLDKGGFELIVSFTGYVSKTINIDASSDRQINIEMQKADNSMSEVVIKSSAEVENGWEKHGQFFLENFIGSTPFADSCTLLNPQALKFFYYKRNDRLKVLATEPLLISNRALGYQLRYQLDSFVYFMKTDLNLYRGNCFYTVMEGSEEEVKRWEENRKKAYQGSRLHFLRSYYDSTLKQEGFTVDILSSTIANKFDRLLNPYDSTYYYFDDETGNAELSFPKKVSITYSKSKPEKEYLEQTGLPADVPLQISYIDFAEAIVIRSNGFFLDQKSWTNQGYWSWKNLADQLPYDYEP